MTPADKSYEEKVLTFEAATALRSRARTNSNSIVFTNGCFDLLHRGHVTFLQRARALGDVMILGLNSDHSVRRLKGPGRPILLLEDRVALLAGLESVDHICVFEEDTPETLLHLLLPDILVKGGDYRNDQIVGRDIVESGGGEVTTLPFTEGCSTTEIIRRILLTANEDNKDKDP